MQGYKDNGIEWIGEVPIEWNCTRLKDLITICNGKDYKNCEVFEMGYPVIGSGGEFALSSKYMYDKESVLFGRKGTIDKPLYVDRPFWTVDTMFYSKMKNSFAKYIYYYSTCFHYDYYMTSTALPSMTQKDLGLIKVVVPSLIKQQKIADFLDNECERIDKITEKIEKQIEILKEYKKSLITETVTRGLNKNVKMRDSGVDIIGCINDIYQIMRLRYICSIDTGNHDTQDGVDDGIYDFFVRSPIVEKINEYDFEGEAILMAGDGVGAGKVFHHAIGKFGVHQRVYIIYNFKGIIPRFLYYFMSNFFSIEMEKGSAKSTVDSIRMPMLKNFSIVLPLLREQQQIADFLDQKCSEIDLILSKKANQLDIIKEHKKSLIYEYVTGKKRVGGIENGD